MTTEQEMLQILKSYLKNECVGVIDSKTNKTIKNAITKDAVHLKLNKIKAQHQEFTAHEIGELFEQAKAELIENGDMMDGEFAFQHIYNH